MLAKLKRPVVWIPIAVVAVAGITVGLFLFQPWKLFLDQRVDEAFPVAVSPSPTSAPVSPGSSASPTPEVTASESGPTESATPEPPAEPVLLASGSFISHEHATTGQALIYELPDGSRVLRIEGLDTSNGPDLKVWLTDAPVIEGTDGWYVFDDGAYVDLGVLKGNQGNANYPIPNDVDLSDLTSVSIWCDRFSVSFGAAELQAA
jgi:hypothetical protein